MHLEGDEEYVVIFLPHLKKTLLKSIIVSSSLFSWGNPMRISTYSRNPASDEGSTARGNIRMLDAPQQKRHIRTPKICQRTCAGRGKTATLIESKIRFVPLGYSYKKGV